MSSARILSRSPGLAVLGILFAMCWETAFAQPTAPSPLSSDTYQVGDSVYVRALTVDRSANLLWVGTSVGALGIDLATRGVRHTFTRDQGLANEYIFAVGVEPKGKVWFGTNAGGASTYQDGAWKTYFPMHGLADYWVYSFTFDNQGRTWIGTWDGLSLFDPASGTFTNFREELINIWVYGLDIDAKGRVWVGTEGGISMYDGANWSSWTSKDGLGAPNVTNLPRSGNTGLGTRSRHDVDVTVGGSESYNPDYVFAVKVDNQGRGIWFGTWGGGVSLFDGDSVWKSYSRTDGLAGDVVYSIAQQDDGTLWLGTNHGVSRFDGSHWTTFDHHHGLLGPSVYALAVGLENDIWVGTKGGVTRLAFKK